ncbi:ABC transporter ATP-binding protein [Nakamurella leprariae]|uniref:ABC transporter ATP-binding protein n=1 Tax=Nakamurella leprariae TaxID=2803911 RepID=A0A939C3D5_9ACTN|nr:ABC transporter ATP-binding protein [Nakamurella leprariae]MBM9468987.1 ABC transporter ATP-binding protein [Nakamurella leprariae]
MSAEPRPPTASGLSLDGVGHDYLRDGRPVPALAPVSLDIPAGQFACVIGPSGSGKTTLVRAMAGLLRPSRGTVRVGGAPVTGPPTGLAMVHQEYGRSLFPWKTVRDNVDLALLNSGRGQRDRRAAVTEALHLVGLPDVERAYPWQLSGGMQQRVAIARAVVAQPRILLMDEPFAAVDAQTRADLEDLVRDLWHRLPLTVVFVTHDIDESVYLGQRVVVLGRPPAGVRADVPVPLPDRRDQVTTRAAVEFTDLRAELYGQIAAAKLG